jgi:Rps23 Pro-64 3,4-dihydroxylase Tpa1-like proline 4-hydroxylase
MIRPDLDPAALAPSYAAADPYPHAVIDGFLRDDVADRVADILETIDVSDWYRDEHAEQVRKRFMPELHRLPPDVATALAFFNGAEALSFFERLTGVGPLLADQTYTGGGVHMSFTGGRLGIHADFNLHPTFKLHRRLNALLFLNRDWDPDWNGQLELWNESLTECVRWVEPGFNRLVVFNVTDRAYHGVPQTIRCPTDRRRLSLALYYYTLDRPDAEKAPFHWASWKQPNVE